MIRSLLRLLFSKGKQPPPVPSLLLSAVGGSLYSSRSFHKVPQEVTELQTTGAVQGTVFLLTKEIQHELLVLVAFFICRNILKSGDAAERETPLQNPVCSSFAFTWLFTLLTSFLPVLGGK